MTNIPGIADEAGTGLENQIRATKALGWHHVELRAVEVPGCPTANVHTVVLFHDTNAAPTDEHAMGLNYVEYGRRVCSSLSVSDSFKGLHVKTIAVARHPDARNERALRLHRFVDECGYAALSRTFLGSLGKNALFRIVLVAPGTA